MCSTCSPQAIEILNKSYYETLNQKKLTILDTEELEEEFGEVFDELIHGYALFVEQVFQGKFDEVSILSRQKSWEERLEHLIHMIQKPVEEEQEQTENPDKVDVFSQLYENIRAKRTGLQWEAPSVSPEEEFLQRDSSEER